MEPITNENARVGNIIFCIKKLEDDKVTIFITDVSHSTDKGLIGKTYEIPVRVNYANVYVSDRGLDNLRYKFMHRDGFLEEDMEHQNLFNALIEHTDALDGIHVICVTKECHMRDALAKDADERQHGNQRGWKRHGQNGHHRHQKQQGRRSDHHQHSHQHHKSEHHQGEHHKDAPAGFGGDDLGKAFDDGTEAKDIRKSKKLTMSAPRGTSPKTNGTTTVAVAV